MHSSRMRTARLRAVSGGGVGVVTWSMVIHLPPPPPRVEVTHACENITFARYATRAVKIPVFETRRMASSQPQIAL